MAAKDWQDDIVQKLIDIFESDAESLARILHYLDGENKAYENTSQISPTWRMLKSTLRSDTSFESFAKRLIEDTKTAENDPAFKARMQNLYRAMMVPSDKSASTQHAQRFDLVNFTELEAPAASAFIGLAHAWSRIPPRTQIQLLNIIPTFVANTQLSVQTGRALSLVSRVSGSVVVVGLAAAHIGFAAFINIRRWWNGEISGKRCAKNVIDSIVSISAGVGGGIGGAAVGAFLGPFGAVVGGVGGAVAASYAANLLSDYITQKIFGIPKEEALENAYRYLGVSMTDSNSVINEAYHRMCRTHHPDKGGDKNEFQILQVHMSVIKVARGDEN